MAGGWEGGRVPNYTTSDGTPFSTSWTQAQVIQWWTSRGVDPNVAMQEATVDFLRYGDDGIPSALASMLPHLLERSNQSVKAGTGTDSSSLNTGIVHTAAPPPPVASLVTTMGAAEPANHTPTVGPIGLAYPDDPVNYSTNEVGTSYGYSEGGILPSGIYPNAGPAPVAEGAIAPPVDNTMMYVLLIGLAVGAYFLLK
jgi:hypothetical protein